MHERPVVPVVQRIEHGFPKPEMVVRFHPGTFFDARDETITDCSFSAREIGCAVLLRKLCFLNVLALRWILWD